MTPAIPTGEIIELLVALIRNRCVNDGTPDSGHEERSVATLEAYFGIDGAVVEPHPGRRSVVYRVPGTTPGAPTLAFLPHLDVVPADPGEWAVDPFAGERSDGFVWGRGAVDMLDLTAAMAAVFRRHLRGEAPRLPGDLVFAAVADEEAGGRLGAEHLVTEHWELVACDHLLTEVAGPALGSRSRRVVPVTVAEKGPAWRRLRARGRTGHASQPHGARNALLPVARAVTRLGEAGGPVHIGDEWRRFVAAMPVSESRRAELVDPDRIDAAVARLALDDPAFASWVHACTHLTVTPTLLGAGTKANVIPDLAEADIDVRTLPGQDARAVDDHFRKVLGPATTEEVETERVLEFPANGSPPSGVLWEAIGDAVEAATGSRALAPALTPVATDARFFRARGVVAYGVGLFDDRIGFGEMLRMFHGPDERVSERSLELTTRLLADVVARYGARVAS